MFRTVNNRIVRSISATVLTGLQVAGCGSSTEIERPPTYVGEMTSANLEDVYLATGGGKRLTFEEVFVGFEPQTGFLTDSLPFPKMDIAEITYEAAQPVAAYYDDNANNNGWLEGPELLVLYIREGAIGLGHPVDYVGVNPRLNALATSPAETGALVEFVKKNKTRMTEDAQRIFRDIEQLGVDNRNRAKGKGSSGR